MTHDHAQWRLIFLPVLNPRLLLTELILINNINQRSNESYMAKS